jgi:hypothetical protein
MLAAPFAERLYVPAHPKQDALSFCGPVMTSESLDFTFGTPHFNRQALLSEAAEQLDLGAAHLGPGDPAPATPEGALVRALQQDAAEFAAFPDVYRIRDQDFLGKSLPVPLRFKELSKDFRFYWLYLPIGLRPLRNWAFSRLEVLIEFNAGDAAPHLRPKAYQILPDKKFQRLFEVATSLDVKLDENFEFTATVPKVGGNVGPVTGEVDASVAGKAAAGLGLVVGPFKITQNRAKIDHTPTGMEKVFWRLDGAEFFEQDAPNLVVILQVPNETKHVYVSGALLAYRNFKYASAGLREAVEHLSRSLRDFLKAGAPLRSELSVPWDLTPRL